jgi:hypothetical protein
MIPKGYSGSKVAGVYLYSKGQCSVGASTTFTLGRPLKRDDRMTGDGKCHDRQAVKLQFSLLHSTRQTVIDGPGWPRFLEHDA